MSGVETKSMRMLCVPVPLAIPRAHKFSFHMCCPHVPPDLSISISFFLLPLPLRRRLCGPGMSQSLLVSSPHNS